MFYGIYGRWREKLTIEGYGTVYRDRNDSLSYVDGQGYTWASQSASTQNHCSHSMCYAFIIIYTAKKPILASHLIPWLPAHDAIE